ncbi:roquin-2-like isoform X2 [Oncorhynchus keta]|uniref:roquin-2-like isoform X2 n=1 Tax=Oncorhynchus keta TaxID=8018 RepID=UPI00227C9243|nr:roquin-2-like isoform X2 [Oncorhynchus keta]
MPVQAAQWTEFLSCPICYNEFDSSGHKPISLGCSHTVCKTCLHKLHRKACPFDQTAINTDIDLLPVNSALLQLVGAQAVESQAVTLSSAVEVGHYEVCRVCVEELALYLKPISGGKGVVTLSPSVLSRPMQRKLVTLVNCQLVEEEGRLRAVRAGRSLGERTVTELILQHQNPQQLSANLWAAVRARGCQFLGPATQEDALKLVLLALEDGSALSRKVLVLFVVQKLEARFPQASKTSIGHVVQLLYRASCFKVTKRDEDSSLMQLKEEFRAYEALRREHDAQIVHIAMEAGLRISPEQWSSLLYGDLIHKSHMQSIIDKLQSPESFAKSVQELTIVLQRTGDSANLNSLRPHLELLANIDHSPDAAAAPCWEELESVMLAVKVVVHGLVEFIHNFSRKSHETAQPQPNSKYKTSICRDLRQQGGCPRGSNCTFAHTQDELEKNRMRNKKISGVGRPFLLAQGSMGSALSMEGGDSGEEACTGGLKSSDSGGSGSLKEGATPSQLMPRGEDMMEEMKRERSVFNGSTASSRSSSGSMEQKSISPPKTPVNSSSAPSPYGPGSRLECDSAHPKQAQYLMIRPLPQPPPHQPQSSELCYQDPQPPYDVQPYQPASNYYPSAIHHHKPCVARFLRSSHVPESSLPPSMSPLYSEQYPSLPPPREHTGPSPYGPSSVPQYGPLAPAHGGYAPLYDSRHMWRPQLYHREDARSNSLPPEVLHSSVYQPPLRERYASLDSPYCSAGEHRAALHRNSYGRFPLGCEDLFRRKQEQWAHHHHGNVNRPSQSSPVFTVDFGAEHDDGGGGQCMNCKFRGEENLSHYSPWSCGTISTCISPFEPEYHKASAHSRSENLEVDNGEKTRWLHTFEPYRRLKDEDPSIPFETYLRLKDEDPSIPFEPYRRLKDEDPSIPFETYRRLKDEDPSIPFEPYRRLKDEDPSIPFETYRRLKDEDPSIPFETYRRLKDEDPSIPFETYRRLKDEDPSIPFETYRRLKDEDPSIPFETYRRLKDEDPSIPFEPYRHLKDEDPSIPFEPYRRLKDEDPSIPFEPYCRLKDEDPSIPFEPYRRLRDEDPSIPFGEGPIIPFGEGPIISKWGVISRASRTGYHTTDPVQATACQGSNSTIPINFRDYGPRIGHGDYRWSSGGSDSSSHSSFLEGEQLAALRRSFSSGEKVGAGDMLQTDYCKDTTEHQLDRDVELELSVLDVEDPVLQDNRQQSEPLELREPHLLTPPSSEPMRTQTDKLSADKMEAQLLKKMAFRRSLSPVGLGSGGLSVGKLMMRTGPLRLGDMGPCPNTGPEMLLNGN